MKIKRGLYTGGPERLKLSAQMNKASMTPARFQDLDIYTDGSMRQILENYLIKCFAFSWLRIKLWVLCQNRITYSYGSLRSKLTAGSIVLKLLWSATYESRYKAQSDE